MKKIITALLAIFMTVPMFAACEELNMIKDFIASELSQELAGEESTSEENSGDAFSSEEMSEEESSSEEQSSNEESSEEQSSTTQSSNEEASEEQSSTTQSSEAETDEGEGFTAAEKALFKEYFGFVIPYLDSNEYYVEEYTYYYSDTDETEVGINFYSYGNTKADFNNYKALYTTASGYTNDGTDTDSYGDVWYYFSRGGYYIDMSYYADDYGDYVVDVYVYEIVEGNVGGDSSDDDGDDYWGSDDWSDSDWGDDDGETNVDLITNNGKGLPSGTNGVYNVDFKKATYVKDVTDQGYYLDGCPTTGKPTVLVIPVEFSDIMASSKGYTIDKLKTAFNGGAGTTDYHSVHDYYYQASYGQLDIQFTVLDSWFKPKNKSTYYANATIEAGGEEMPGGDQLIMDEALAYLESRMNLSNFDSDGNGTIDAIVMVNTLEINGDVDFQWAYRYWNYYGDNNGEYYEYDGVYANDYIWASYQFMLETYDASGDTKYDKNALNTYTYIHEFGHVLGADDYYDTAYVDHPLEGYDMMDAMTGDQNAYTKFNLGWITTSRLVTAENSVTLTLEDFTKNGDTIIIANNWDETLGVYQEYYVLMYYTNNGLNSGDGFGYFEESGIVVYHINASLYKEVYEGETYYDIYNNNTNASDKDYGTEDNLIEFVKTSRGEFTYTTGDSLSATVKDDSGNKVAYTFKVDSMTSDKATITFTKNK